MPFYHALGGGGGGMLAGTTTGWTTTTSSTSSSYMNPFYGATGGTTTDDWNSATGSTVIWINTVTTTGSSDEWMNQDRLAQAQLDLNAEYQRMISQQQRAMFQNDEYNRRIIAQEAARPQDAAAQARHQADLARQQAAFEAQEAANRQRATEFVQTQKTARDRARELLLGKLSPEQRKTFADNNWFVVEGSRTKTKYRIRGHAYAGNIDVLDVTNKVTYRLCVHCAPDIPLEDHLLSQKLMLELAEDSIVKLANRHAA